MSAIIPVPRFPISVRPATLADVPFMDALQKLHTRQVGWMPTKQFEGKIKAGHVLVAEESAECRGLRTGSDAPSLSPQHSVLSTPPSPVGYLIGNDQYFKHDDVGIIYQMNVVPGRQRGFVGATLLKAQFERSAYGCKLYCCWCAQDIEANRFWESMGFVPLAYRAGSETKGPKGSPRVHIFWQKRIRQGDATTPWWFPSQTSGGSIREDRIVWPIPPGTHWSDAKPIVLPGHPGESKQLPEKPRGRDGRATKKTKTVETPAPIRRNGLMFDIPRQGEPLPEAKAEDAPKDRVPRVKAKNDPRLVAAARELRDRWLERVNAGQDALPGGKYDVSRALPDGRMTEGLAGGVKPALPEPIAA